VTDGEPETVPLPAVASAAPARRSLLRTAELGPLARMPDDWATVLSPLGGRPFHGKQLFRWIHARSVLDPSQMTDLPAALRQSLQALGLADTLTIASERRAADATRKLVVKMHDGATVETVLIPRLRATPQEHDSDAEDVDDDEDDGAEMASNETVHVTQCISTQVGCAMGCVFCASGVAGLKRQMTADEIVAQVIVGRSRLEPNEQLRNVVLMGMGEPLHNYDATVRALKLLTHPDGIALSSRRITVSTSGLVPEIERLGKDFAGNIGLAISLHATDNETRSKLMPINRKYPLEVLMGALRAYPLPKRRRITIEYTLVAGRNDSTAEARKLVTLLRGLPVKVNLIPMNPIEASTLGPTSWNGVFAFQKIVTDAGYSCFIRRQRGDDVSAACGQLALSGKWAGAKAKVRVDRS
jgi:23S rRNA (adenine2503-C2)-methyltransferase